VVDAPGVEAALDDVSPLAPVVLLAPVLLVELLDVSAPGAGVGVVVDEEEEVLGDGAGAGVVTVFSSFLLQAARPATTRAAMMSERFMFFPLGEHHTVWAKTHGASGAKTCLT
jgi:hypothetical protein